MDAIVYVKFVLALALVLGLIMAMVWAMKRLGLGDGAAGSLGRRRRLRAVESVMLDSRHRAVLVRRDSVEHLVLIGPNTSQVIERAIVAPAEDSPAGDPNIHSSPLASAFRQLLGREARP